MNPEIRLLKLFVEDLQRQIDNLRLARDVVQTESIRKNVLEDVVLSGVNDATTTGIVRAVNEAGSGGYNVAKAPDRRLRITVDGTDYYIGLYNV